jgi:hypothetical protein
MDTCKLFDVKTTDFDIDARSKALIDLKIKNNEDFDAMASDQIFGEHFRKIIINSCGKIMETELSKCRSLKEINKEMLTSSPSSSLKISGISLAGGSSEVRK